MKLPIVRLDNGLPLPTYNRGDDAGLDLFSAEDVTLEPSERAAIGTGIALEIPKGYAGFVLARSGRALKQGIALANAPGLIDSGYRGEIKVIVVSLARRHRVQIRRGEKIAQLVVQKVTPVTLTEVNELSDTRRR